LSFEVFVAKFLLCKERKKWNNVVEISDLEVMRDVERFCEGGGGVRHMLIPLTPNDL
jgi:hypothetical protein